MGLRLPDFAQPIAEARRRGFRPADLIVVSDGEHGLHRELKQPLVRVRSEQHPSSLDWRWIADLEVEVATAASPDRVLEMANAILAARPNYARIWHLPSDGMVRLQQFGRRDIRHENAWVCEMELHGRAPDGLVRMLRERLAS